MTTIPSRIDLIRPVIDAVLAQTVPIQHIELNVPYHCMRTGEAYQLPSWLESIDRVKIFRTEDYGRSRKAPTFLRYQHDPKSYTGPSMMITHIHPISWSYCVAFTIPTNGAFSRGMEACWEQTARFNSGLAKLK